MTLAFVFPGQGSQWVGMGKSLFSAFPDCKEVFDEADHELNLSLSKLCFEGPEEELQLTVHTQPALLTVSTAALRALSARGIRPDYVAGHSLGEYSALVAAGSLEFRDALVTVKNRGRYMQEAVPQGKGAMAAILGLDAAQVEAACVEAANGAVVSAANFNSPGQIVIAGDAAAVARATEVCIRLGAKRAVPLKVSAPFHCALMMPAQTRLAKDLAQVSFYDPHVGFVNNLHADLAETGDACRAGLIGQVSAPVRWQQSVERLGALGVDTFVEVGPGNVLRGLVRKTLPKARVFGVEDEETLVETLEGLSKKPA